VRIGKIARNPMQRLVKVPAPGEPDHGMVLDQDQLRALLRGFKGRTFYPMVATAAFTGARRNEILALRWSDLDVDNKTLRIERALEATGKYGIRFKEPKTARGKRTIAIDDELVALLVA
jgi:integrase